MHRPIGIALVFASVVFAQDGKKIEEKKKDLDEKTTKIQERLDRLEEALRKIGKSLGGDERPNDDGIFVDEPKTIAPKGGKDWAKLLGGEPTATASEPALDTRDDDKKISAALKLFKSSAGQFPYRIVEAERLATYVRYDLR